LGIYVGRIVNYRNITIQQYFRIEYGRIKKRFDRTEPILRENDSMINATLFEPVCKPIITSCTLNTDRFPLKTFCLQVLIIQMLLLMEIL